MMLALMSAGEPEGLTAPEATAVAIYMVIELVVQINTRL